MNLGISFLSGIIAAFTPCVIVLMPILLYRFFHEKENNYIKYLQFIIGFIISYIALGYILSELFTSSIQNGIKFGLGLLFIILGILSIMKKLNPINLPSFNNSFLLGLIFAIIISFNPCTLPYLSLIIVANSKYLLLSNLILFGLGMITPSILFSILGKKILNISNKSGPIFNKINNLMHIILILSGIYLIYTIKKIEIYDIYIISLFLGIIFILLMKTFFLINNKSDILKLKNIFIIISLIIMIYGSINHCSNQINIDKNNNPKLNYNNQPTCSMEIETCEICKQCIYTFGIATIFGFVGLFLMRLK